MERLEVLQEGPTGTLQVAILALAIILIVGVKVEVTTADRIHHRGEHRHILEAVCLRVGLEEPLVVMELPLPIIPKVVNLQVLVLVEVRTQWAVIEVSSMVGSSKCKSHNCKLQDILTE